MPIQPADIAQPPMPFVIQDTNIGAAGQMTWIPHVVADEAVGHAVFVGVEEQNDIDGAADGGDFEHDAAAAERGGWAHPARDGKINPLVIPGGNGALKTSDTGVIADSA